MRDKLVAGGIVPTHGTLLHRQHCGLRQHWQTRLTPAALDDGQHLKASTHLARLDLEGLTGSC